MDCVIEAVEEDLPGGKCAALFARRWDAYREWFLQGDPAARPYYLSCLLALDRHMPELTPTFERLADLVGGEDIQARFLSMYCPPPSVGACSQAVCLGESPVLVRNYDHDPRRWDAVILKSAWNGRSVVAVTDCIWGVLDGVNEDGLAASLSFGGRWAVGEGFAAPLLVRYILETCTDTEDAVRELCRIPVHMSYNITVVDRAGVYLTAYLAPDRPAVVRPAAVSTNHQGWAEWTQYALATLSLERERALSFALIESDGDLGKLIPAFLSPPVYSTAYDAGRGTLYTSVYDAALGDLTCIWPHSVWRQSIARFEEGRRAAIFASAGADGEKGMS